MHRVRIEPAIQLFQNSKDLRAVRPRGHYYSPLDPTEPEQENSVHILIHFLNRY
jgi:hypothetical protein